MVLLAASYIFYAWWNVKLTVLILLVTLVSYGAGRMIELSEMQRQKKYWLAGCIAVSFGLLGVFKYANMLIQTLNCVLYGVGGRIDLLHIILPVGISFYTFQAVSYVIDVYRGKLHAEHHLGYYALYLAFFPQLVAGPIERAGTLLPQIRAGKNADKDDITKGLQLLLTGYVRKIVGADLAAPFVNAVFSAQMPDGSAVALGAILFAVQIYCDFSGYSEIAMGSARLFGIQLMPNFLRPYSAANIRDFWRRWHVSLTVWFTDYVYIPLGGNRRGASRQIINSLIVFSLCGLWHGADWHFLIWGVLHGIFLAAYTLFHRSGWKLPGALSRMLTLGAVCFAWIFFRADSMSHVCALIQSLCMPWHPEQGAALLMSAASRNTSGIALMGLLLAVPCVIDRLPEAGEQRKLPMGVCVLLLLTLLAGLLIRMDSGTANAFIYFQF